MHALQFPSHVFFQEQMTEPLGRQAEKLIAKIIPIAIAALALCAVFLLIKKFCFSVKPLSKTEEKIKEKASEIGAASIASLKVENQRDEVKQPLHEEKKQVEALVEKSSEPTQKISQNEEKESPKPLPQTISEIKISTESPHEEKKASEMPQAESQKEEKESPPATLEMKVSAENKPTVQLTEAKVLSSAPEQTSETKSSVEKTLTKQGAHPIVQPMDESFSPEAKKLGLVHLFHKKLDESDDEYKKRVRDYITNWSWKDLQENSPKQEAGEKTELKDAQPSATLVKKKVTQPNGDVEEGDFDGDRLVQGKRKTPSDVIWEGTFHLEGWMIKGTKKHIGVTEKGEFNQQGKLHGKGKHSFAGIEQEGDFLNGNIVKGIMRSYSVKQQGEWAEDGYIMKGKVDIKDKRIEEGDFKYNANHTSHTLIGKITYLNNEIHFGEFKKHDLNGHGIILYPDGRINVGFFNPKLDEYKSMPVKWS